MKILFIYKYEFIQPLGIMYLSSVLKKQGHDCFFIDIRFEKDLIKEIKKILPDIIAYSITTGRHKFYQKLNLKLKRIFKFFSFFGGPHCTFFPKFIYNDGVDAICRGEGELPFLELVENLKKEKDITKIKNLWVKINGRIYKNQVRNLIEDLDSLPFPDRELISNYNHYKKMHRQFIITGRGCPYNCSYCFNPSYNKLYKNKGKIIRKRSVFNVIKELNFVKNKYSPKRFHFLDDNFIVDSKWVLNFCRIYKKKINIPFIIHLRISSVSEKIIKALKYAGCITILYAIESGNDYIRNNILKRNMTKKQIITASNLFNKYGLNTYAQNIIGIPEETIKMAFETLNLNIICKPSYSWVSIFQPYPGTELYKYSKRRGYFVTNFDSFEESYYKKSIIKTKDIKKLERFHHLFSLGVAFPFFIPIIKILIRLPLNKFYFFLWNIHRAWCYFFKVKWIDLSELFIREG